MIFDVRFLVKAFNKLLWKFQFERKLVNSNFQENRRFDKNFYDLHN